MDILSDKLQRCQQLIRAGDLAQAEAECQNVLSSAPEHAGALNLLGCIRYHGQQPEEAERAYRRALALAPDCVTLHMNLGRMLAATERTAAAIACFRDALELSPDSVEARLSLAQATLQCGDADEAETLLRHALELAPGRADAHRTLGITLLAAGRPHEALLAFEQALRLRPDDAEALDRLGRVQCDLGLLDDALESYRCALAIDPFNARMRVGYAQSLLSDGRFDEGWAALDARLLLPSEAQRATHRLGCAPWRGEVLAGCRIVLYAEHDAGDAIQFIRYAPMVRRLGAEVIVECPHELQRLFASADGVDHIVSDASAQAADFHCALMSLPRLMRTNARSIPAEVPYLSAPADAVPGAPGEFGKLNIGLVWRSPASRTGRKPSDCPLHLFEPALGMNGVRFHSLQRAPNEAEAALLERWGVADHAARLADLAEAAACVEALDLVITVDGSIAHLAGALGKPVWLVNRFDCDWRWQRMREDSPWYPTMRQFRQKRFDDWLAPTGRVAIELARVIGGESQLLAAQEAARAVPGEVFLPPERLADGDEPEAITTRPCRHGILRFATRDPRVGRALLLYGEYAEAQLALLQALLRRGDAMIEVDAGVGAHTVGLARRLGPKGRLLAFETNRAQRELLERNLRENRLMQASVHGFTPDSAAGTCIDELGLDGLRLITTAAADPVELLAGARATLRGQRPLLYLGDAQGAPSTALNALLDTFGYRRWTHAAPLFNAANFTATRRNVFGDSAVRGLLCVPQEASGELAALLGGPLLQPASIRD